ncbi:MAG TPA: hypothetical protein VK629_12130, partial [Steroidobacteraceae bacterium]|nr:hypothetical protein [Steroidobacteraceae bacterium]
MRYAMVARLLTFALIVPFISDAHSQSSPPPLDPSQITTLAEVVVTGEQPGPRLWRATRNGRVLWIYGTVTPKPDGMKWRSKQVPEVLDDTQEVIDQQLQGTTWAVNFGVQAEVSGPFKTIRSARMASKIRKAQDAPPPLRTAVPKDLYDRYAKLKAKYVPKNEQIELA